MYMCSCFAVTTGQITKAVAEGVKTWKELTRKLKLSTNCGTCGKDAKLYFEAELAKFQATQAASQNLDPSDTQTDAK